MQSGSSVPKLISGHQPAYLPWLGLIHKVMVADEFVFMDDVQFIGNDFIHRNRFQYPGEVGGPPPPVMRHDVCHVLGGYGTTASEECGVLGHSFGGFTSCRVTELDPRVKAILPMTLALTRRGLFERGKRFERPAGV